jgi:hypothetical protein
MNGYNTATEHGFASCLPPEAYMRIWNSTKDNNDEPKFMSTVYPTKKPITTKKKKKK